MITITRLATEYIDAVVDILRQDTLRYADGNYPDAGWISHFLTDDRCVSLGLFTDDVLVAILISEKLSANGCMMWYIAVKPDMQGNRYGSQLLSYFETHAGSFGIHWVFLNATAASLPFYHKAGYITSSHSKVWEHYKDLTS